MSIPLFRQKTYKPSSRCIDFSTVLSLSVGGGRGESGMVQWLRVEARDREIRVRFPSPAVISDLVVVERD